MTEFPFGRQTERGSHLCRTGKGATIYISNHPPGSAAKSRYWNPLVSNNHRTGRRTVVLSYITKPMQKQVGICWPFRQRVNASPSLSRTRRLMNLAGNFPPMDVGSL